MRPLTLLLCALALALGTAGVVTLLTRSPDPPRVTTIELGDDAAAGPVPTTFAPPLDDDEDDPFDDED